MGILPVGLHMPSELLSELVSEVSNYKMIDLGEREAEFLARIGEGYNSSYKIFSRLKSIGTSNGLQKCQQKSKKIT